MLPLVERRRELEADMANTDHRIREAAATELAHVASRLAEVEEQWLEVAAALEAID